MCASAPFPKAWRAKPATPLQALRAGRAPLVEVWKLRGLEAWLFQRLHPSRACRALCSLWPWKVWRFAPARSVLCSPGRVSAPCPACASTPPVSVPLCLLCGLCVLRNLRFPCVVLFVSLCGPSCSLCFPEKHSSFSQRLHLSRACRAFCSPFSVAVEGLARCACTLCSPGRRSRPFWGLF